VWINTAWAVVRGLENYGEEALAADFALRVVMGAARTLERDGHLFEFYDADENSLRNLSRKKGNLVKQITLGGKPVHPFCGWNACLLTLLVEHVLGYRRQSGRATVAPTLPVAWEGCRIRLEIPQFGDAFEVTWEEGAPEPFVRTDMME
jgi:hypothetical protein